MKMFKFTRDFVLLVMLLVLVLGTDRCCSDIVEDKLGDVKSDVEDLRDIIKDLGRKLAEQFEWSPSQIGLYRLTFIFLAIYTAQA